MPAGHAERAFAQISTRRRVAVSAKNRKVYYLKGGYLLGVVAHIKRYTNSTDHEQQQMLAEGDLPYVLVGLLRRQVLLVPSAMNEADNLLRSGGVMTAAGRVATKVVNDDPDGPAHRFSATTGAGYYVLFVDGEAGILTINK